MTRRRTAGGGYGQSQQAYRGGRICNSGAAPGVNHGVYGAVNTATGKVAWTIPILTTAPDSGMTVAGDLVFFGDSTGLFYAANAATGEILWVFDASTVPNAGGGKCLCSHL